MFIIGALILVSIVGCIGLKRHIYFRTDCYRFNIDNIELVTDINVPALVDSECSCESGIKESLFTIDTSRVDLKSYIKKNKFVAKDSLYINEGETTFTTWVASVNPRTAALKFWIVYR